MLFNAIFYGSVSSNFQMKICGTFLIFYLNKNNGCLIEPPVLMYTPQTPIFLYKVGFKGVFNAWAC